MYRKVIPRVRPGDPVKASDINAIVEAVERALKISVDGSMAMFQSSAGTQLRAKITPQPFLFVLTDDTPDGQGYVLARRLYWWQDSSQWVQHAEEDKEKIYDPVNSTTFSNSISHVGMSQWAKTGFVGQAIWNPSRGERVIDWIEHVARFINFKLTADLADGDTTANLASGGLIDFWDGTNPTANSGKINLVSDGGYTGTAGDKGTAVWRSDLDNSTKWQYQIIDKVCS